MNVRPYRTAIIGLAGILAAVQVEALSPDRDKDNKNARIGTSQPSLEGALFNFNLFKQQPAPVVEMVSEAWKVLSVDPNASYADLSENPEFQSLCAKNGMDVLGGPLLGSVTAEGVKVWIRTLKPAASAVDRGLHQRLRGGKRSFMGFLTDTHLESFRSMQPSRIRKSLLGSLKIRARSSMKKP